MNETKNAAVVVAAFNADAIDKVKGGISYPPNLADATEETPNGTNGIPCRTTNERRKRGTCGCRVC